MSLLVLFLYLNHHNICCERESAPHTPATALRRTYGATRLAPNAARPTSKPKRRAPGPRGAEPLTLSSEALEPNERPFTLLVSSFQKVQKNNRNEGKRRTKAHGLHTPPAPLFTSPLS